MVINDELFKEFQQFQQEYTSPGISQVPVIKLLELWITAQESVDVVQQFGHKYAVLHQSAMDDLVLWLLNVRDRFELEGRAVLLTLQRKMFDQQLAPLVPPSQPSSTGKFTHSCVCTVILEIFTLLVFEHLIFSIINHSWFQEAVSICCSKIC